MSENGTRPILFFKLRLVIEYFCVTNFISIDVGKRVWTVQGFRQHGLAVGLKTNIPANTGGVIAGISISNSGVVSGQALYTVDWDNGEQTRHYSYELICIGSFHTIEDFRAALRLGSNPQITLGPQRGFRHASMVIPTPIGSVSIDVAREHEWIWRSIIEPILKESQVPVKVIQLERKIRQ